MVRKKCEWYPGSIHHITTRENRRSDIFKNKEDYIVYLAILKEVNTKLPFELYCYCLMTNQVWDKVGQPISLCPHCPEDSLIKTLCFRK